MAPAKTDIEKRVSHAFKELRQTRDELRKKVNVLGKDAGDVLIKDVEDMARFLETKLLEIGEIAVTEAKRALASLHDRVDRVAVEVEKKRAALRAPAPPRAEAPAAEAKA